MSEKIIKELHGYIRCTATTGIPRSFLQSIVEEIERLENERDEAYERSAQVCDEQESLQFDLAEPDLATQARRDAAFIRALKAKT